MTTQESLVRTDVAAKRLGVHIETLYRWIRSGRVKYTQPGRRMLIRESEIVRLLEERRRDAVA